MTDLEFINTSAEPTADSAFTAAGFLRRRGLSGQE